MPETAWTTFLLRYGELGLKGHAVRRRFERRLVDNMERAFERAGVPAVLRSEWGRIFLETSDPEGAADVLRATFGLVSASPTVVGKATIEDCQRIAVEAAAGHLAAGDTFAIRARRTGTHGFSSVDVGREAGSAVWKANPGITVDLDDPDVAIGVEVRNDKAYAYTDVIDCPGGLPRGVQGRVVVACTSNAILAATWMVCRRGPEPLFVVPPAPGPDALAPLAPYLAGARVWVLPEGDWSRDGIEAAAVRAAHLWRARAVVYDHDAAATIDGGPPDPDGPIPLRPLTGWVRGRAPGVPDGLEPAVVESWTRADGRADGVQALDERTEVRIE